MGVFGAILVACLAAVACAQQNFRRFEYKHSFRAPNLAQRDGTIPFWTVSGDGIASTEQLRLAPSMRSRKGIAWNKRPMTESDNFEIEAAVKVTGQGRIGADGLAFWYTAQAGTLGPVYGSNDYWTGLGIFFDSFDNDGQKNNPMIGMMINDGTRTYDHQTDGSQQLLSSCQKDFRNKPFPVRIKIEYAANVLQVSVDDGMSQQPRYQLCMRSENVFLPKHGYFGVSAATGGLADDHDIVEFSVYSLFAEPPKQVNTAQMPTEEKQKYDAEFQKQMNEYEQERAKFKEEHPDKVKEDYEDPLKFYEDATARELRLIYEAQTGIHLVLKGMDDRLRELHTNVGAIRVGGGQPQQQVGGGAGHVAPVGDASSFTAHEKQEVVQSLREVSAAVKDMRSYVNEIFTKTYNIEQKVNQQQAAGGHVQQQAQAQVGYDSAAHQKLDALTRELQHVRQAQMQQQQPHASGVASTQECASCVGSSLFITIILLQACIILAFVFVRTKQDKAKFY